MGLPLPASSTLRHDHAVTQSREPMTIDLPVALSKERRDPPASHEIMQTRLGHGVALFAVLENDKEGRRRLAFQVGANGESPVQVTRDDAQVLLAMRRATNDD